MTRSILKTKYAKVKVASKSDIKSLDTGKAIFDIANTSLNFLLKKCDLVTLVSKVPNKKYFTFAKNSTIARPANEQFFLTDTTEFKELWRKWLDDTILPVEFAKLSYTAALAPCLAMELFNRQNKKGPATYFECLIGHVFSKAIGINPTKRVLLEVKDRRISMTMDFLIDLGDGKRKVHLPVKMSTRERVVQAWAHQRLLDATFGVGHYRGIMVLFSETKLDSRSLEVVEICVPDQWLVYQSLLAKMDRIYYFDRPERYQVLTESYPDIIVIKQFGEFFKERTAVL